VETHFGDPPKAGETMEKDVFAGKYTRVTLEERDGHTFERVYLRNGVCVIPITADGNIRCIREKSWNTGVVRTKLVSGYINPGEEPIACAVRELNEETGMFAGAWELYHCADSEEGTVQKSQYYFVAHSLVRGMAHPDSDEKIIEVVDLSYAEVRDLALRGEFGSGSTAFVLLKLTAV